MNADCSSESAEAMPVPNFKEKIRCGEIYRNLNGNEMFQKFYYRCLECSIDLESSAEFEEHVLEHFLNEDEDCEMGGNGNGRRDVIDLSSEDEDEEAYALLRDAVEVTSMIEDDTDMPVAQSSDIEDESDDDEDEEDEAAAAFPCDGLRRQALHHYSEPEKCCTECPAYFTSAQDLENHVRIHRLRNIVACTHCFEVFANNITLNQHIRGKRKKRRNASSTNDEQATKRTKNDADTTNSTDLKAQQNDNSRPANENNTETDNTTNHAGNDNANNSENDTANHADNDTANKAIENDVKCNNQNSITMTTTIAENNENNRADNTNNIQVDTAKVT